jgi:hypothetical protein
MSWTVHDLDALLTQDVDAVADRARTLDGKARTAALRDSLAHLESSTDSLDRLKTLLFVQSVLASFTDGKLSATVADHTANELARIVTSSVEPDALKRPALDGLALLFLKAKELTTAADGRCVRRFARLEVLPMHRSAVSPSVRRCRAACWGNGPSARSIGT